ncbi:C-type lectin domain family 10 member A-like [Myripristis murdjan]|uniref:C-type lectin domain family 10 member A-like n=1 Tax=Myripristis murdjan TaxID=586833 RepID=UPI0011762824|nr:C-type lectin domain family 10 member A-like [Myripristis murdjan]
MAGNALIFILLSGLGSLPSCFPRQYHLIETSMTWSEAQSYCRQHYTDLATVSSEEDVAKLNDAVGSHRSWIGLYDDINSWRWSLQNKSYYGEGEAEFRMWASGQPDNSGLSEYGRIFLVVVDSHSSVTMLRQRLKDQGVSDDVQLRWVTQPDGRVFHKEGKEEEDTEEQAESCGP